MALLLNPGLKIWGSERFVRAAPAVGAARRPRFLNSIHNDTAVFRMHGSTPRSDFGSLHNAVLRQCTALLCVATASAVTVSKKKQKTKADLKI
jgi:hypothetical protein